MEIRVHGPGQEPAAVRGHHAHARATTSSSRSASASPKGSSTRADDLDTVAYCLARRGRAGVQRRHRAAAAAGRRSTVPRAPLRRQRAAAASAARPRSTRSSSAARRSAAGPVVARSVVRDAARPACAPRSRCSTRPAVCTPPALFTADGDLVARARGRRPPQRARQAHRRTRCSSGSCRSPTTCCSCRAGSASRSCRRPRWPGSRSCARCRRRRASRSTRPSGSARPLVGLPARRPLQRLHASRAHRPRAGSVAPVAWKASGEDQGAQADGARPLGRVQAERHRASRSRTTTRRSSSTVWENRDNLPYAWRILRKGVCDGCALGVAGFHDWTIDGVHLCTTRLNLLEVNTMRRARPRGARPTSTPLRTLERRGAARPRPARDPMVRRRGERGFTPRHVGRGARPRRRRIRADDARPARRLPHRARHHQRGVLRRAEGRRASSAPTTSTTRPASCHAPSTAG